VLLPIIALATLLLIAAIVFVREKHKNPHVYAQKTRATPFERAMVVFGSCLVPMYTYLISVSMSPFRCFEQDNGSLTLVPSSNLDCYDELWSKNWPIITLGLLYVILIPGFFIFILWKYRGNHYNNTFYFRYGYLVAGLKPQFYWWNVFQLFRKSLVVMMIDLSNSLNTFLRMFLVVTVLLSGTLIETLLQPRREENVSRYFGLM
jgi:hypothetical protein